MTEMIQGRNRFDIFENLRSDRTLLEVSLIGKNFQSLTLIEDINLKKGPSFLIDDPPGFKEAILGIEKFRLAFEFIGKDSVPCKFRTSLKRLEGNKVWLDIPDTIEREQRRDDFRVETSMGTILSLKNGPIDFEIHVLNLSLGGLLGVYSENKNKNLKSNFIRIGKIFQDMELNIPSISTTSEPKVEFNISIQKGLIKRYETETIKERKKIAFQFFEMASRDKNLLREAIYKINAQFLKKRSGLV